MKTVLQREQQTRLEHTHACSWHSIHKHITRQKYTLVCKVLTEKTESSCPQPVSLGNLVGLKTTKDFFHNWHDKHSLKLAGEIYCLYCKHDSRFSYKNTHSTSYILLISKAIMETLQWSHQSNSPPSGGDCQRQLKGVEQQPAGTLQRHSVVLAVEMHLCRHPPFH